MRKNNFVVSAVQIVKINFPCRNANQTKIFQKNFKVGTTVDCVYNLL